MIIPVTIPRANAKIVANGLRNITTVTNPTNVTPNTIHELLQRPNTTDIRNN